MTSRHLDVLGRDASISRRAAIGTGLAGLGATLLPAAVRAQPSGEPIRVGVSAALTAQFAQNGLWMKNGVALAAKQINGKGGIKGRPVQVFYEDDQGPNPTAASNAVIKLLTQDKVIAVIGPHFTPAILPVEPLFTQYKVAALTGASGPVVTQQNNPWVFRVRLDDATGAVLLVKYVTERLGWKKIGIDYVNTAFGQSGINAVKAALAAKGITPVATQTHLDSTKDFTSQLLTFQQAGVDGIIVWTDDQPSGLMVKQLRTLGMPYGLAGSTTFSQPPFLSLAGDAANGIYSVTDFVQSNPDPTIAAWKMLYHAAYNEDPELYATTYHDAMNLVALAAGQASEITGPGIADALMKVKDWQGIMTSYSWSKNGDMVHSGLIAEVKGGQPTVIEVIKE
ncbi:MAG: ABC transporter substrate-binding protein [Devosia sp.]|nr:ABC transporter substrate-binding protein [Devosia sp.]